MGRTDRDAQRAHKDAQVPSAALDHQPRPGVHDRQHDGDGGAHRDRRRRARERGRPVPGHPPPDPSRPGVRPGQDGPIGKPCPQVGGHMGGAGIPIPRISRQGLVADHLKVPGDRPAPALRPGPRGRGRPRTGLGALATGRWRWQAVQALVEHHAQGVHVAQAGHGRSLDLLGAGVRAASHGGHLQQWRISAGLHGNAEVQQVGPIGRVDDDVRGLHVPVDDARGVGQFERFGDGGQPAGGASVPRAPIGGRPAAEVHLVQQLAQRRAVDVRRHDEGSALVLAETEHGHDRRMAQPGGVHGFLLEARHEPGGPGQLRLEHLDGHIPLQREVPGQIDHAHAPPTDLAQELEVAQVARQGPVLGQGALNRRPRLRRFGEPGSQRLGSGVVVPGQQFADAGPVRLARTGALEERLAFARGHAQGGQKDGLLVEVGR
jgi:hypothetical protein